MRWRQTRSLLKRRDGDASTRSTILRAYLDIELMVFLGSGEGEGVKVVKGV